MDKSDDFNANLARALNESVVLTEKAQREQVERLASERLQKLVQATAHLERAKASTRFAWALFFLGWVVVAIAIYMRVDGRHFESLVTLLLSLIPLLVGARLLDRFSVAQRKRADALEQLHAEAD